MARKTLRERGKLFSLPVLTANGLKLWGAVLMALYYFSGAVVQRGVLGLDRQSVAGLRELLSKSSSAMGWATLAIAASLIGVMAAPVFAFLTAEGAARTGDMKRYVLGVLAAAAVTEVPFDLAMSGRLLDMSSQNPLWTVLIALVTLWLLKLFANGKEAVHRVLAVVLTAAGCFWAVLLGCDLGGDMLFGLGFVLLSSIFYLLREHKLAKLLVAVGVSLYIYATGALGLVLVALYGGQRREMGRGKYVFYAFCPVLMLLLALWTMLLG